MKLNIINKKITSLLFAALMITSVFAVFVMPIEAAGNVDLAIKPSTEQVLIGETFTLDIQAMAGNQSVTGISAFLNFNSTYLEVVSIKPENALPTILQNRFDNAIGTIDYSAGDLELPFPNETFTVATIEFKALNVTSATAIEFNVISHRQTMVDYGGDDVTGDITGAIVTIVPVTVPPTAITISPAIARINVTEIQRFNATVLPAGADQRVTWSTTNATIGTIDATGLFTARAKGTVNVTARSVINENITGTATVTVTVTQLPVIIDGGIISGRVTCVEGNSIAGAQIEVWDREIGAYGSAWTDVYGNYIITGLATSTYEMRVYPPWGRNLAPAFITDIVVTANKTTIVNVTMEKQFVVTPTPTAITINPETATLNITETQQFTATVLPVGVDQRVTWSTTNAAIGTIDATGLFTARAKGTVTVTARSVVDGNITGTATVTVTITQLPVIIDGGIISGRVTCVEGNPVAGAQIEVWDREVGDYGSAWTDVYGNYIITGLSTSTYEMRVYPPWWGWEVKLLPVSITDVVVTADETTIVDITMEKGTI